VRPEGGAVMDRPLVLDFLRAVELLKRGVTRLFFVTCGICGQKNRVDRWRLLFGRAVAAKCGRCAVVLARRTGR
jgi:hypothetical protein